MFKGSAAEILHGSSLCLDVEVNFLTDKKRDSSRYHLAGQTVGAFYEFFASFSLNLCERVHSHQGRPSLRRNADHFACPGYFETFSNASVEGYNKMKVRPEQRSLLSLDSRFHRIVICPTYG